MIPIIFFFMFFSCFHKSVTNTISLGRVYANLRWPMEMQLVRWRVPGYAKEAGHSRLVDVA